MKVYFENFDGIANGWHAWISNAAGPGRLNIRNGQVICQSPWWIDYNHAPPGGAGYLHLLMCLRTCENAQAKHFSEVAEVGGMNRFVREGYGTDLRDSVVSLRLRGEIDLRGAQLVFHVQSRIGDRWVNYAMTGQPFAITREWSEQSVVLDPDPAKWTCLGSRVDRADFYGSAPVEEVLKNVNGSIILVLYPLKIVPLPPIDSEDQHALRAGEDYSVDRMNLPSGEVCFDWIRITFNR